MKKIKWILLFWILTLLWIGSSFWYLYDITEVSFKSDSNKYINFWFVPWNSNTYSNYYHYYDNIWSLQKLNILRQSTTLFPWFNLSSYSLTTFSNYSYTSKKYYLSDSCADVIVTWSSYWIISHIYWTSGCNSQNNLSTVGASANSLFYVNWWDNCINSWVLNTNTCDYSFYKTFWVQTFDSRYWLYSDNQYSWSDYSKTSLSFPFSDSYSFFGNISWNSDWTLPEVYHYSQKYLFYSWWDFTYIWWLYVARINDLNSYDWNSGFQVIALSLSWVFDDLDLTNNYFNYWIFDCPVSAQNLFDCTFNDWWVSSSLYTNSSITWNVLRFFTTNYSFYIPWNSNTQYLGRSIKNYYNRTSNYIYFYRFLSPYNASSSSWQPKLISTTFQLISDWNNYFTDLFPGGWSQSTWSMAINTWLINLCLTSPSFYDLNTIFCNRVFGGRDLTYVQWLISSGAYLQSYIDWSGNLVYVVDIIDEPWVLTWSVSWECYGDRCINTESWSWGDVEPREILHLSWWDILSSWYYLWFFESINETWYFFKCPYSYNNSRWVAWRSILNAIWRDPFLPINCFIAAYENWRRVKLFDDAFHWYSRGPLMDWDTQNHKNLFTFFDVLLSTALIFFLMKFYHLFK